MRDATCACVRVCVRACVRACVCAVDSGHPGLGCFIACMCVDCCLCTYEYLAFLSCEFRVASTYIAVTCKLLSTHHNSHTMVSHCARVGDKEN